VALPIHKRVTRERGTVVEPIRGGRLPEGEGCSWGFADLVTPEAAARFRHEFLGHLAHLLYRIWTRTGEGERKTIRELLGF